MYLGSETPYKKEKFEGDWYAQIFLNYSKQ